MHSNLITDNTTGAALSSPNQTYSFYRLFGDAYGTGSVGLAEERVKVCLESGNKRLPEVIAVRGQNPYSFINVNPIDIEQLARDRRGQPSRL